MYHSDSGWAMRMSAGRWRIKLTMAEDMAGGGGGEKRACRRAGRRASVLAALEELSLSSLSSFVVGRSRSAVAR
jgi:hypothetical protein